MSKIKKISLYAMLGAITFGLKFAMSGLPNIEPVSLLLILYTLVFSYDVLYILFVYIGLEILVYGFNVWAIGYLYIWLVLIIMVKIFQPILKENYWGYAFLSGIYGILFGALYIPLYIVIIGFKPAIAWWIAGIPYDIIHSVANCIIAALLLPILHKLFKKLIQMQYYA